MPTPMRNDPFCQPRSTLLGSCDVLQNSMAFYEEFFLRAWRFFLSRRLAFFRGSFAVYIFCSRGCDPTSSLILFSAVSESACTPLIMLLWLQNCVGQRIKPLTAGILTNSSFKLRSCSSETPVVLFLFRHVISDNLRLLDKLSCCTSWRLFS
jgi:hypothetical protein